MLKITRFEQVTRIDSARTIAGRGVYWTTAYLVDGLLIDSGCAHSADELDQMLSDEPLTCIVNTHSHEDHIGANGKLKENRNQLEILAHPDALPVLASPREAQPLQPYRRIFWGWPDPSTGKPVEDSQMIETHNHTFQVIYTPGHSPDHLCLYEPEHGWLFSGDLYVGGRDRALRIDYHIWQIISSLKRVATLPLTRVFPGCARVRENPLEELTAKISYLEETGEKVIKLHDQGMSKRAIAKTVFGGPMLIEWMTLGHFTRLGLVNSYLGTAGRKVGKTGEFS